MKQAFARSALLLMVVLLAVQIGFAPCAFAQSTTSAGSIQGTITDPNGAVVPDTKVVITNKATGQQLTRTTTGAGTYNSGPLTSGTYTVRAEGKGFKPVELTLVVQVGNTSPGNITLSLGSETQVVEVTGESVRVNTEQPTVQGVLTANQIENLPVSGRNFLDLAQLEPGVQIQDGGNFDPTKNGFSSISFGGRFGRTARISLDGIDISDETVGTTTQNVSAGAISEFQISQSTLDPSTELTSSGAVNVVTKSGTNTLHGEGFYLFRDKALSAAFPGGQDSPYQRNHYGGSLGGPLIKNHLFWFANVEHIKQDLLVPLATPSPFQSLPQGYGSPFRDTQSLARLDWQAANNVKVFYRFTYNNNSDVAAFGQTFQPFANRDNTPSHGAGIDFTTGNFTHSIRWGYLKFTNHIADAVIGGGVFDPAGTIPVAIRIGGASTITRFGPSRLAPQATFQQNQQIKYDGSHLMGKHTFRYGLSFNRIRGGGFAAFYGLAPELRTSNNDAAQTAADAGPFPGQRANPLNYIVTGLHLSNGQGFFTETPAFGLPAGGQGDDRFGVYFGDSWKIKTNLTITAALRWQRDTGRADSDIGELTCDQIDPTLFNGQVPCTGKARILDQFGGPFGGRVRQPNTNFGPQVGFAWDPRKNGKTVIRGGAGIYYENAVFNNVLFDRPGRLAQGLFFGTADVCPSGQLALPGGTVNSFPFNGTNVSIASLCGQPVGSVMTQAAALQAFYQQQTAAAGPQSNPNFIGNTLANGLDSTGNNFIAPDYRTPRSYQMNFGVQHEIRNGMIVSADFLRNIGLRYLMAVDTNHVGDSRFLNMAAAQNAISVTNASFGCANVACSIAAGATIADYAGNGLDSGATFLAGFPAGFFGLDPNTGAAFPGINPLVGENQMLFPVGRSAYTALQLKLTQNMSNPLPKVNRAYFQVSYSLSRFNSMVGDQDFVNTALDFRNPTQYFGPNSLDRTHMLSFGGTFDLAHGPRLSIIGHVFSPLAVTPLLENQFRAGEIFNTDITGDGQGGDVPTGMNIGSFGRSFNGSGINNAITAYNSNTAGKLTPAGQALVTAGLFTPDQLVALGAVADTIAAAPSDQFGMTWLKTFDFKFSWPIHIKERATLEPSVGFFNLFNNANYNSPSTSLDGVLSGSASSINGTSSSLTADNGRGSQRIGLGTGVNTLGAPRQIEFGLKLTF